jgi:hypothetical protein
MCQSYVRLPRLFTSLAVAGMLGFGAHTAFAESTARSCPGTGPGWLERSCSVGSAGNAYCDGECKLVYGSESVGECFVENCCLCAI